MSNLLSRWSKSSENLREKKKWNIINVKTKKKKNLNKSAISTPIDYKHTAGVNPSDGKCFSEDQSSVPAAKTAEIIKRKKIATQDDSRHLFADIQLKIGSMDILSDVMSVMDKECPPRCSPRLDDFISRDGNENDHIDRNSLGNTTDYTSDTESRGTGYSTTSVDDSEVSKSDRQIIKMDTTSQKDSFYSTTDISQCETDREVQL
jgi:hypothetical protein